MDIVEPNNVEETRGQEEALMGGSIELEVVVSIEPDNIILSKVLADAAEPSAPLPKI